MLQLFGFLVGLTLPAIGVIAVLLIERRKMIRRLETADRDRTWLALAEKVGGVGTWVVDQESQTLYWSGKVYDIHARDRMLGPPDLAGGIDYYHPQDRAMVTEVVSNALRMGEAFEFKARLVDEKGREKAVISRAVCKVGDDGEVKYIFGVFIETAPSISIESFGNDNPAEPFQTPSVFTR